MSKPTFDSIASAKAKLAEELKKLEAQEANLLEEEASHAFLQVSDLLSRFGQHFTAKQKADIATQLAVSSGGPGRPKKTTGSKKRDRAEILASSHPGNVEWSWSRPQGICSLGRNGGLQRMESQASR